MKNLYKYGDRWRFRKTIDGKEYSFYFDEKPREKDIFQKLSIAQQKEKVSKTNLSISDAMYKYINCKDRELSASTTFGYYRYMKSLENSQKEFMKKNLYDLDNYQIQCFINELAKDKKPKTVKNIYSFLKAILKMFRNEFRPFVTLPRNYKKEPYIPTDNDIQELLKHTEGTKYDTITKLALYGLRASEINALTMDDIGDGTINVDKAKVRGYSGYVLKETKTEASIRVVKVDKSLTDQIKKQGFIMGCRISTYTKFLSDLHKDYGLPHFSMHKMRHYYCSVLIAEGVPFKAVQKMGGWSSSSRVMQEVYAHQLQDRDYSHIGIDYLKKLEPKSCGQPGGQPPTR